MEADMQVERKTSLLEEFKKDWSGWANLITEFRILAAFVSIGLYIGSWSLWWLPALLVFIPVAATDKLDGYVARSSNSVTKLGTWLDPLADKVLVCGTLIALSVINPWEWIPTVIILTREIDVSMMRRYAEGHDQSIPVTDIAKVKTFVQCTVIAFLFLPVHGWFRLVIWALVAVMIGFTIYTWLDYRMAFRGLFGKVTLKVLYWR